MQLLSEHLVILTERGYTHDLTFLSSFDEGDAVLTDPPNLMRIVDNIFSNLSKYADKSCPVEFKAVYEDDSLTVGFSNRVRTDVAGVESNGIGLKTCKKLAEAMGHSFEYGVCDGMFRVSVGFKTVSHTK
jgi:signal transduction histidine kinase